MKIHTVDQGTVSTRRRVVSPDRSNVLELRQYTLHPGRRDELIELFDREFVESQEDLGMTVWGQFRDLGKPDRFVWLRGFDSMDDRHRALDAFYGGPVWAELRDAANATMIDCDDVLLLRPIRNCGPKPGEFVERPAVGVAAPESVAVATVMSFEQPISDGTRQRVAEQTRKMAGAGVVTIGAFETEAAENTFTALPVREGLHVIVWLTRYPSRQLADRMRARLAGACESIRQGRAAAPPQHVELQPTGRSRWR